MTGGLQPLSRSGTSRGRGKAGCLTFNLPASQSDGSLYLAVVLDAFIRRIVGWAMETHLRRAGVRSTDMALGQRRPAAMIHQSDQGTQCNSIASGIAGASPACACRWARRLLRQRDVRKLQGSRAECADSLQTAAKAESPGELWYVLCHTQMFASQEPA